MSLELKIPPALLLVITAASIWGISVLFPLGQIHIPGKNWLVMLLGVAGLLMPLIGALSFRKAGTTVDPRSPDVSTQLVIAGIYKISRNPMYLGFLLLLVAWVFYLGNWLGSLILPLFVIYLNHFQIAPEEQQLLKRFGYPYQDYLTRVRRWI